MEKLWKKAERKICALFGGKRRGPTGRDDSDCVHPWLAIEIKCRAMPQYLCEWMGQALANAQPGQLAIVVWHQPGEEYDDDLVILRSRDFRDWFGDGLGGEYEAT